MSKSNCGCSCCGSGCCGRGETSQINKRRVVVDFLYLDLSLCEWCRGTDKNLEEALAGISNVLELADIEVVLNKINVTSEELAIKHKFISSPTIRVDGKDIQMEVRESECQSCGDLCGDDIECRVWMYKGQEYTIPPKALIMEGLLNGIFGREDTACEDNEYVLPENLKKFYAAMNAKKPSCCSNSGENKCCTE